MVVVRGREDDVRTGTYKDAIMQNRDSIADKVVMDVGCGTGILAIFCAHAGAKRVYAIDASDIAFQAAVIVEANNLSDTVTVLHGRIEDVDIEEMVDVIVSEWMGYMLLNENMLPTVIFARDKWLKPGGLILPSNATLYMAPITHSSRYFKSIEFWRNVFGINMSAIMNLAKQSAFEEPCVETITGENVLTSPCVVMNIDCYNILVEDLETVKADYDFKSVKQAPLHGFAFWFVVEFSGPQNLIDVNVEPGPSKRMKREESDNSIILLSTGPEEAPTHWKQTLIFFYNPIELKQDQTFEGSVTISPSMENARFLDISLKCRSEGNAVIKRTVLR